MSAPEGGGVSTRAARPGTAPAPIGACTLGATAASCVNGRTVILALVLALATLVTQPALAGAGDSDKWAGGFHALDGMLILGLAVWLAHEARRRLAATAPGGAGLAAESAASA